MVNYCQLRCNVVSCSILFRIGIQRKSIFLKASCEYFEGIGLYSSDNLELYSISLPFYKTYMYVE